MAYSNRIESDGPCRLIWTRIPPGDVMVHGADRHTIVRVKMEGSKEHKYVAWRRPELMMRGKRPGDRLAIKKVLKDAQMVCALDLRDLLLKERELAPGRARA